MRTTNSVLTIIALCLSAACASEPAAEEAAAETKTLLEVADPCASTSVGECLGKSLGGQCITPGKSLGRCISFADPPRRVSSAPGVANFQPGYQCDRCAAAGGHQEGEEAMSPQQGSSL